MVNPQNHIKAISAQLLQERPGHAELPGLREALLANTPVPAQLPAIRLTEEMLMQVCVLQWLAERLRAGEMLSDIHADYQYFTGGWVWMAGDHAHPMITLCCLALDYGELRSVLRYNDDALCAVLAVQKDVDKDNPRGSSLCEVDRMDTREVIVELRKVADHLQTLGPTLYTRLLDQNQVIVLGPVIWLLREVARDLEALPSR